MDGLEKKVRSFGGGAKKVRLSLLSSLLYVY